MRSNTTWVLIKGRDIREEHTEGRPCKDIARQPSTSQDERPQEKRKPPNMTSDFQHP